MNLRELYARARLIKLALDDEYDLEKKQKLEILYNATMQQISDLIQAAPF